MQVFVAGATGVVGRRLVPMLVRAGHSVTGMTRSAAKSDAIRALGAEPVVADALDAEAVRAAVGRAKPEIVIHQLTALPASLNIRDLKREAEPTNRLRTLGTDYLLAAAQQAGARRFLAQSYGGWMFSRDSGPVMTEEDAADPDPPVAVREVVAAIDYVERTVPAARGTEGLVLRYGGFYGPGTAFGAGGGMLRQIRQRRVPIIGAGTGVWSFLHIDDAAAATVAALERGGPGVYNIADDDPAQVAVWLPELARILGAKPPRRIPGWLARLLVGEHGVAVMTAARGLSNAKARRELRWLPQWATWREGFRRGPDQ
jgi:nucleoside-diphosphate-sugar epimerase